METKDEIISTLEGVSDGKQTTYSYSEVLHAMEVYAKQESISFAKWYVENCDQQTVPVAYDRYKNLY
jgi:hypothetical protein